MAYNEEIILANIRKRRLKVNYSQEFVAAELGISQNAYSKIELGYTKLTLFNFFGICEVLHIGSDKMLREYFEQVRRN
ncbi:helix-turn-helix domain-containing protein [Mucilaginibacter pedocola]|uniref:HTH cro/C1-type domain-containing protein n=1 Tax=Mucilaginibacter pedocola TaxID=1792845 RepID=A0A1S9PHF8_9SPHI|nr:helix-turn-helix transcriptional regulator [Mucilaginibacter pedocola]OOQ60396.1 hypothetical protein BC343_25595 [Mucilaginibacter pedocola]